MQDTVITFTPGQLVAAILAICAAIITISGAISVIAKAIEKAKKPGVETSQRLTNIENRLKEIDARFDRYDEFFDNDKNRIDAIERGTQATQKALLALMDHALDASRVEELKQAKTDLELYLIHRS